jgi:uncharacterized 2Fe-2S/4Fe-4S cluster protein (DUF4445 family)
MASALTGTRPVAATMDSTLFAPAIQQSPSANLGVAVDIGTTEIRTSLWDRTGRRCLGTHRSPNPQARFGGDILSRLSRAAGSQADAAALGALTGEAIATAIGQLCREAAALRADVREVAIVGNTAMLVLLTGHPAAELLATDSWERRLACAFVDPAAVAESWGLARSCRLRLPEAAAGFVGSDLLAGVFSTGLARGPAGSLLLDFGANTEIALWDGDRLWATSAAGGPAFEWCGSRNAMPARSGAVWRVRAGDGPLGADLEVIGGGEPAGLCASGLVDAIAVLVASGRLTAAGRFSGESRDRVALELTEGGGVAVAAADVDALQRAKAGVAASSGLLLREAGMSAADIRRVCVSGTFGTQLDVANACAIGLLPPVDPAIVELCGNTALAGCGEILCGPPADDSAWGLPQMTVINMSLRPEFDSAFFGSLHLRPWRAVAALAPGQGGPHD